MSWTKWAARLLAAREVIPGDDADLTRLLRDRQTRAVLRQDRRETEAADQLAEYVSLSISRERLERWETVLAGLEPNVRFVVAGDEGYPSWLSRCWDAPPFLFIRGELTQGSRAAVVGSRAASDEARKAASTLAGALVEQAVQVVSGLAVGIDTAAHQGALQAGGRTLAVLGTGIERTYPAKNTDLAGQIAEQGALISQFPPDAPSTSTSFLIRNRVIAGLCETSYVMAGEERSGSRNEAEAAVGYGRRVLLWEPELGEREWARTLVKDGKATFFTKVVEVVG